MTIFATGTVAAGRTLSGKVPPNEFVAGPTESTTNGTAAYWLEVEWRLRPTRVWRPGEEICLPADEIARLKADGFLVNP